MIKRLDCLRTLLYECRNEFWGPDQPLRASAALTDLAKHPAVREIILNEPVQTPLDAISAKFAKLLPPLHRALEDKAKAQYAELALAVLDGTPAKKSAHPLGLAIVSFDCEKCDTNCLRWPTIVQHDCFTDTGAQSHGDDKYAVQVARFVEKVPSRPLDLHRRPPKGQVLCEPRFVFSREIVKVCGFDPNVATVEELDACGARLRCVICATLSKQEVFGWRDAVSCSSPSCQGNFGANTFHSG